MRRERWEKIDELLDAALQLEPEKRTAFLDVACAGDETLRRQVDTLLASDKQAQSFIEEPAFRIPADMLAEVKTGSRVGTAIGPYTLLSPLGAGGMGDVYLAQDTRLGRKVALKLLRASLSNNTEFRQRFEREARAISTLSHPHICSLYDIGREDGVDYLVMEYIEGQTLTERLAKGAMPADEALRCAIEIAGALDSAHRAGLIHRDLKPGNIMLTKSGAKLLDFGLVKRRRLDSQFISSSLSDSATEPASLTAEGAIVGTLQYMSPEQLNGEPSDARTDIFAFGAVLYEMITGRRAFEGKSQASLVAAILSSEPQAMSSLQPMTPPALDRVVKTCLAKDPDDRWQSAHDLMMQLKWITEGDAELSAMPKVGSRRKRLERFGVIATAFVSIIALVALAVVYFNRSSTETYATRFVIPPPEKTSFEPISQVAVSPDGRRVAFVAVSEGKVYLWVRSLDSLNAQVLQGTEGAANPFWSPDGHFIAFAAQGKLKRIEVSGGSTQTLCDTPPVLGGTWNRDGVILVAPNRLDVIYRVPAVGGVATPVTTLDQTRRDYGHAWPKFLPDGRHFLYSLGGPQEHSGVYVGSLDSKETRRLLPVESNAAYAPPGYLLYVRETTLFAQPFDAGQLQIAAEPFPIAEQVWYRAMGGRAAFSVSENGVLAYERGSSANTQLVWFNRSGKQLESIGAPGEYQGIDLSPDETRVVVERNDPTTRNVDIWTLDLLHNIWSRHTFDPAWDYCPLWSPDGSRIVFGSIREGPGSLYQMVSNSAGHEDLLLKSSSGVMFPTQWSSDGRYIIYHQSDLKTGRDIWILPMHGDRQPIPFLRTEFIEGQGVLSPDGRWMVYVSNESGRSEVYVQPFPATGIKWQVSTGGGVQSKWRRDGKELFYIAGDGKLTSVDVNAGADFKFTVPKALFQTRVDNGSISRFEYAVTADGQRFLLNTPVEDPSPSPINVVMNWTADLKR